MAYHTADSRSGPLLYVCAAATLLAGVCAILYPASLALAGTSLGAASVLKVAALTGLLVAAPLAIATSFVLRCCACDRLLLPLVYDGRSLFSARSPSPLAVLAAAAAFVAQGRARCPHCGIEAQV